MIDPVFEHRLSSVERAVETIAQAVQEIAHNTTQIVRLEMQHAETRAGLERAFEEISKAQIASEKCGSRISLIEVEMPGIKETRGLVNRAMVAAVSAIGIALLGVVIIK